MFGRALILGATIRLRAPDVSLVSSAHFDQPRHNIFKFFFFCLSDSDGCRAHSPSVVLLKYNNGNELLGVTAVHMWECGDWNGLPRKSSADAAEPLNQLRLLFHIYYSYFFSSECLCLIKGHYIRLFLRFMAPWCTSLRGR